MRCWTPTRSRGWSTVRTYLTVTFLKDAAGFREPPDRPDPATRVLGYDQGSRAFLAVTDNSDPGRASSFMAWLDRTYGKDITTRSLLTVQRIVRKLEQLG